MRGLKCVQCLVSLSVLLFIVSIPFSDLVFFFLGRGEWILTMASWLRRCPWDGRASLTLDACIWDCARDLNDFELAVRATGE